MGIIAPLRNRVLKAKTFETAYIRITVNIIR